MSGTIMSDAELQAGLSALKSVVGSDAATSIEDPLHSQVNTSKIADLQVINAFSDSSAAKQMS